MKKASVFHIQVDDINRMTQENQNHVVKKGDTLYKIAKMHNVKLEDLIAINNLKSHLIYPNQIIVIPKTVNNGAVYFEEYVIVPNDTIEAIASKLGISVELLIKYNDISKLMLSENQVIQIPKMMNSYVIKENDTLESILLATGMTLEELMKANTSLWLAPGMTINIR